MGDLLQVLRQKENMSHLETQQWKKQIMEMGHALQQYVMPEGLSKKHLRAGNVMTWLWMEPLCSSIGAESKYITFQEQEKTGATRTEANKSYILCKALLCYGLGIESFCMHFPKYKL